VFGEALCNGRAKGKL